MRVDVTGLAPVRSVAMGNIIASAYDRYFESGYYAERYPTCNPSTLAIWLDLAADARRILDFGAGNGRYTLPLLNHTAAHVVAYDISSAANADHARRLPDSPDRDRVTILGGDLDEVARHGPYDVVGLMFGVLSHIQGHKDRIDILTRLRRAMADDRPASTPAKVIVSVPNLFRRFRVARFKCAMDATRTFDGRRLEKGDIVYHRQKDGKVIELYYHLYTPHRLRVDLEAAGFKNVRLSAESYFPESSVTRHSTIASVDRTIRNVIPASLGYCILAVGEV